MTPEELLPHARLLVSLLEDPHYGMVSWNEMVSKTLAKIGSKADTPEVRDCIHQCVCPKYIFSQEQLKTHARGKPCYGKECVDRYEGNGCK